VEDAMGADAWNVGRDWTGVEEEEGKGKTG